MHDPAQPAGPSSDPTPGSAGADYEVALERVGRVLAWCAQQILAERRAAVPDPERLEQLKARQRECAADQNRLGDAEPDEIARIAAAYEATFKQLTES
ncbi:hypothetical protein [Streptomyces syringium]|uniref:hypothetical protein n=1 Tax=Streptomyces syringium TaxID=76729 RepID=UPI0033D2403E